MGSGSKIRMRESRVKISGRKINDSDEEAETAR
jgi:hypothetical protein